MSTASSTRERGKVLPFRRVTPKPEERYKTCVPLVELQVAAGAWRAQEGVPEFEDPNVEWVTWDGSRRFAKEMFVARVLGRSMEPVIPDGAYCLFRRVALPSLPERPVLVRHAGVENPETGGQYTVKRYREAKGPNGEKQVVLEPANAAFAPIVITSPGVDDVRVIGEVVEVLGMDDARETGADAAGDGARPRYADDARRAAGLAADDVTTRTIERALGALSLGREIEAGDVLVAHLDNLFRAGEFEAAGRMLSKLDPERLPPKVLSGVLMVSAHARSRLGEARVQFFERVRTALTQKWLIAPGLVESLVRRHA